MDRNAHLARNEIKAALAERNLDLTVEDLGFLIALNEGDGKRIGELATILVRDTTTVTRQIESLEKKSCVSRQPAAEDRRAVEVFITEEGREKFESFLPVIEEFRSKVLEGLSESDVKLLVKNLTKIHLNLASLSSSKKLS